ncbi:ribonucleoside-diphosphate reductase, adenosylcobalamin-dependent [Oleidesulfovibrio alaskensis G20]|jgi:ribonucleoside-diphosphate reductase alpha chain|uniref:Vitamin B12-dependent ribonucleotide reductase n=1 Tax=Oleidesulfovibrio alaskensis (strain ATCC BAA-1058 / DSM 17464 / G20) TaxID=207559 RepID=Q317I2_OLEA2|nr:vitamin B12-dependent ribonucleotide reductase [Oleidesulfovibrio alaskensis]ABB36914.1 ribonucleoside-diphosphate reductase, adenosylcobalamin-dependent [Oleidesulfovibrio alaskensis G20]MBG0774183.1 vitamin B12-dependent ribonucleotide reductase [Oleidesulfovibrio alaskensis]MBL3583619.1 vitamin B12-dependent ribonucleotide reductase [Oleidesulfovibrio alaskensis]
MKQPEDLQPVVLNQNAEVVLSKRYYRKGPDGEPLEDATGLFWRVASAIAAEEGKYPDSSCRADELAREFYDLMTSWKFLPNSPTLMNAGTDLGQLAACFVLPVGDSIEEIFDAVKHAAMIHKSGGGTGFSFSRLRPAASRVGSTGGVASGPLSFLRIFNTATEQIKQGGTRRGANMGILRVDHPDILEFIRAKEREGEFNNFNLSVALTEDFMKAVEKGEEYPLMAPHSGEAKGTLNAREVFEILVQKAWESGDPGIVFIDRINRDNPTPAQGEMESTNPCGEQPLLPYEACNLGSVNLAGLYLAGHGSTADSIDWAELKRIIRLSVRFLDNVIDASRYPLDRITETVHRNRKIGLGVMGWADLLFQLRIPYDSQDAVKLAGRVMEFIRAEGRAASKQLAKERGPFPAYAESVFGQRDLGPYRNATITTIAPTGTLSILAGCSSGVEPLFALSFARHVMDGERLVEVNPYFEQALKDEQCYSEKLMEAVTQKGSVQTMEHLPQHMRDVFVTAMDIEPVWHLKMQAAFQEYTDNAVSKTVNLPNSATIDDIRSIYWMAYERGCKGVTVYRDGCKQSQVLCTGDGEKSKEEQKKERSVVRERPDIVYGFTQKVETGLGVLYVTINEVDGRPFELFTTIGKSGRSITAKAEAIGRLVSLALRSGVEVVEIVRQLKGIGGEHPKFQKKGLLLSIPDAIAWVMENRYLKAKVPVHAPNGLGRQQCPDCDEELVFQEGCHICPACGFTKCG